MYITETCKICALAAAEIIFKITGSYAKIIVKLLRLILKKTVTFSQLAVAWLQICEGSAFCTKPVEVTFYPSGKIRDVVWSKNVG